MDAAAVRQGAVPALLPVQAAVQLRAEPAAVELPRRAEATAVELPRRVEAAVAELPRRAEAVNAPQWLQACSQEVLKRCPTVDCRRCYPWR